MALAAFPAWLVFLSAGIRRVSVFVVRKSPATPACGFRGPDVRQGCRRVEQPFEIGRVRADAPNTLDQIAERPAVLLKRHRSSSRAGALSRPSSQPGYGPDRTSAATPASPACAASDPLR